jgi:hypothetical protein
MSANPIRPSATMNSSRFHSQSWAPGKTAVHSNFSDVHQHLDDNSHFFDEMMPCPQTGSEAKAAPHSQLKAKVLFQFFDGWPMTES